MPSQSSILGCLLFLPCLPCLCRLPRLPQPPAPPSASEDPAENIRAAKRVGSGRTVATKPFTILIPPGTKIQPQSQSPLLSLPPEIRAQIWALVVGPSRSITLDYTARSMIRLEASAADYLARDADDVRGWETGLLCTCKQAYVEVLPVLMNAVRLKTRQPRAILYLPEVLPPHMLDAVRDLELIWDNDCPDLGSGPLPPIQFFAHRNWNKVRARDHRFAGVMFRGLCGTLGALHGLEGMRLPFHRCGSWNPTWASQEAAILNEVNKARREREGWNVTFYTDLDIGTIEEDRNGLTIIKHGRRSYRIISS